VRLLQPHDEHRDRLDLRRLRSGPSRRRLVRLLRKDDDGEACTSVQPLLGVSEGRGLRAGTRALGLDVAWRHHFAGPGSIVLLALDAVILDVGACAAPG